MEYYWIAYYSDGTVFKQYDGGKESSSEEIDRKKLRTFTLFDREGNAVLTQHFQSGQRLIFRRRVMVSPGKLPNISYLLGWQKDGLQHVSVLSDNGTVENIGDFKNNDPRFAEIEWLPCELVEVQ